MMMACIANYAIAKPGNEKITCICIGIMNNIGGVCGNTGAGGNFLDKRFPDEKMFESYYLSHEKAQKEFEIKGAAYDNITGWGCRRN